MRKLTTTSCFSVAQFAPKNAEVESYRYGDILSQHLCMFLEAKVNFHLLSLSSISLVYRIRTALHFRQQLNKNQCWWIWNITNISLNFIKVTCFPLQRTECPRQSVHFRSKQTTPLFFNFVDSLIKADVEKCLIGHYIFVRVAEQWACSITMIFV